MLKRLTRLAPHWSMQFTLHVAQAITQHPDYAAIPDDSLEMVLQKVVEAVDFIVPLRNGAYPSPEDVQRYVENAFIGGC